jgi:hypothetical protein
MVAIVLETMAVVAATAIKRSWTTQQLLSAPLRTSPSFILKQRELGGYNATDDDLCSGHPVWHAPGELTRDAGSMSLGTSLLQGSHHEVAIVIEAMKASAVVTAI